MPLLPSGSRQAASTNIAEMMHSGYPQAQAVAAALRNARAHGGHFASGGSPLGNPGITIMVAPQHFAFGGSPSPPTPPWFVRSEARNLGNAGHQGFINSAVPGRTDRHNMSVAGGSYVWPADVVSSIGQGNSLAGANRLSQMFKMGPYGEGAAPMARTMGHPPGIKPVHFAAGGGAGMGAPMGAPMGMGAGMPGMGPGMSADPGASMGAPTPPGSADIVTAGGEFITPPDRIASVLGGGDLDHGHDVADAIVKHVRAATVKKLKSLPGPKKK